MVGHEKTDGWPQLKVTEHYVPNKDMRDRCGKYAAFGSAPMACAEFDLGAGTCDIWYSADFPPAATMIEHEREHCQGYDHAGATTMKDALRAFQTSQANHPKL